MSTLADLAKTVPHHVDVATPGPFYLAGYGGGWADTYSKGQRGPTLGAAIADARRMARKYGFSYVGLKDGSGRNVWNIDMDTLPPSHAVYAR